MEKENGDSKIENPVIIRYLHFDLQWFGKKDFDLIVFDL